MKYATSDGGTVEVIRTGAYVDLHLRNPAGATTATVHTTYAESVRLLLGLNINHEGAHA
ncbi:hypothetical protein ACFY04_25940 [Streptomyces sp. NPDC001549]|uniref:hypothetical protein n=1 Tax=Streptomyces sp. NPDC001549 TaxID=3364586 RepID=UPI003684F29E